MNILFTTAALPPKTPFFSPEKRPPLGLGTLISVTRNAGHKTFFVDNYLKQTDFIEGGGLQRNKIDYVAISANNACHRNTLNMITKLDSLRKTGLWKGKIIVGGPYASVSPDNIPNCVDHIVQGEGETAILDIVDDESDEKIIRTARLKDLDSLPLQPWDIFARLPYDRKCSFMDCENVFTMNTSRGCPHECSFCSVCSIWGRVYTFQNADRIISEIEFLVENFKAKGIYFREDNFVVNRQRTIEFCEKLIAKKLNVSWACETRADTLCDEELVRLMSAAGCRGVYLGVESGSQRILDELDKNITVGQVETSVNLCKENNIKTYCSLLVGVPEETYEDYLLTKQLMKKLKPYSYCYNLYIAIPRSPLYNHILANSLYEHMDIGGLLYPPGYDVKVKYFFNLDSRNLVDHEFEKRTDFDKKLLGELKHRNRRIPFFKHL